MRNTKKKAIPQAVLDSESSNTTSLVKDIQRLTVGELIELYAYSQAIVETVHEPLVVLDHNLQVKTANKSFYDTFKVAKKDTEGSYIYELGNKQWDIPDLRKLLEKILPKNHFIRDFEVNHDFEHIGQKVMLLNARRIILEGHKTHLILLAIEDITERKAIQQQKDDFVSMVSHEIKTPITSMKAYLQIVQKRIEDTGNKKDGYLLANVEKQADRLVSLLNELLQVGKVESGKFALSKKKFDLDEVVKKVVTDFQYTLDTHTILRKGEIKQKACGDADRIEQVLINLITNAIKYSPHADKVIVNVSKDKDHAIISVQDFGIGIAKKDLSKVFERYYRTNDKADNSAIGFGLGLYISSEIIKRHDGKIWVESTKGKGSTFFFKLPFK